MFEVTKLQGKLSKKEKKAKSSCFSVNISIYKLSATIVKTYKYP